MQTRGSTSIPSGFTADPLVLAGGFWELFPIGFLQAPVTPRNQRYDGFKCKESHKGAEDCKKEMRAERDQDRSARGESSQRESKGDRREVGDKVRE